MYDLVIRGGTVVDGLGHDPISTDVAVKDGRIAKIGAIPADAAEVVDAGGLALMPGIIDLHTHYDAQVTWDPTLSAVAFARRHYRCDGQLRFRHRAVPAAAARHDHA